MLDIERLTAKAVYGTANARDLQAIGHSISKLPEIKSLISYAIGVIFGRYSLDVEGLAYAGGEWDNTKYSTFIPDADNCLPITDEEYFEYIKTLKSNEFARKVKILDLKSNIYHPYERKLTEKDIQRTVKYMRSLMILEN